MSAIEALKLAWRDYVTDGIPASGDHEPIKAEIRAAFDILGVEISSVTNGLLRYDTKALLDADVDEDDGQLAYVWDDPTPANNTVYQSEGGAWTEATWYFEAVAAVVQPLLDDTEAARDIAVTAAAEAVAAAAELGVVGPTVDELARLVTGGDRDAGDRKVLALRRVDFAQNNPSGGPTAATGNNAYVFGILPTEVETLAAIKIQVDNTNNLKVLRVTGFSRSLDSAYHDEPDTAEEDIELFEELVDISTAPQVASGTFIGVRLELPRPVLRPGNVYLFQCDGLAADETTPVDYGTRYVDHHTVLTGATAEVERRGYTYDGATWTPVNGAVATSRRYFCLALAEGGGDLLAGVRPQVVALGPMSTAEADRRELDDGHSAHPEIGAFAEGSRSGTTWGGVLGEDGVVDFFRARLQNETGDEDAGTVLRLKLYQRDPILPDASLAGFTANSALVHTELLEAADVFGGSTEIVQVDIPAGAHYFTSGTTLLASVELFDAAGTRLLLNTARETHDPLNEGNVAKGAQLLLAAAPEAWTATSSTYKPYGRLVTKLLNLDTGSSGSSLDDPLVEIAVETSESDPIQSGFSFNLGAMSIKRPGLDPLSIDAQTLTFTAPTTSAVVDEVATMSYGAGGATPSAAQPGDTLAYPFTASRVIRTAAGGGGSLLVENTDYFVRPNTGRFWGAANVADYTVYVSYTAHKWRVDYVVADAAGAVSIVEGTDRFKDPEHYLPDLPVGSMLLYKAFVTMNGVMMVNTHAFHPLTHTKIGMEGQVAEWRSSSALALPYTVAAMVGAGTIHEIIHGDSTSASGGGGEEEITEVATITIATPGVVTAAAHGLWANASVVFTTTGALPTGLVAGTRYYVRNPAADTFEVSATKGGASINTSGGQSGTHTVTLSYQLEPNVDRDRMGFFAQLPADTEANTGVGQTFEVETFDTSDPDFDGYNPLYDGEYHKYVPGWRFKTKLERFGATVTRSNFATGGINSEADMNGALYNGGHPDKLDAIIASFIAAPGVNIVIIGLGQNDQLDTPGAVDTTGNLVTIVEYLRAGALAAGKIVEFILRPANQLNYWSTKATQEEWVAKHHEVITAAQHVGCAYVPIYWIEGEGNEGGSGLSAQSMSQAQNYHHPFPLQFIAEDDLLCLTLPD